MFPVPIAFWGAQSSASISPAVGALAITGQAPVVIAGRAIFPLVGALTLTGQAPIVTVGSLNIARTPSVGSILITGTQPSIDIEGDQFVTPNVRSLHFTGNTPVVSVQAPLTVFTDGVLSNSSGTKGFTYTVVGTIPAGRLVALLCGMAGQVTFTSASDSKGNSYAIDGTTFFSGRTIAAGIIHSRLATKLTPGDTITVVATGGSVSGSAARVLSVANTQSSPLDATSNATGTYPPASISVGTPAFKDVAFAAMCSDGTSIPPPSGWVGVGNISFSGGHEQLGAAYKITGVGATFAPSLTTGDHWAACMASYKGI